MDSRYPFLKLGKPWTQSMPSRDVNAATRLAEASWRPDNRQNDAIKSDLYLSLGVGNITKTSNIHVRRTHDNI